VRTSVPEHLLRAGPLGRLTLDLGRTGLLLGQDRAGQPVPLRLFGPEPTTVTFVGGWWAAQVLLLRSLAVGGLIAVRAAGGPGTLADQARWIALDRAAGGMGNRVWPISGEHLVWLPAEAAAPMLHVYDVGPAGPTTRPVLGPWQTQLTVLARLTGDGVPPLTTSDAVVLQRLTRDELAPAAAALPASAIPLLEAMDDVVDGTTVLPVWLRPTAVERQLFGLPVR
jgi:hypothetical protein